MVYGAETHQKMLVALKALETFLMEHCAQVTGPKKQDPVTCGFFVLTHFAMAQHKDYLPKLFEKTSTVQFSDSLVDQITARKKGPSLP